MKTKLLFFMPNLSGGGAEKVTVTMLRQLDSEKFNISLLLVNETGKFLKLVPKYVSIYKCNMNKVTLSIFNLRKVILDIQPDIIYSTLFNANIVVYLASIGIKNKLKIILRSPNSPKLILENKQMNCIRKYFLEKAYKKANIIIAQTPEMKNEIVKYHSINASKIVVFLNPLDSKLINEKIKNIENPFDSNYINVVAAGRLTKQKGFDILIKSFAKVVNLNKLYKLFIIGNEDSNGTKDKLLKLIKKLDLKEKVFFLGFQENPYKYFYYSDLYVLSSRWEGLPNTVLENLYLNKPIVATRCVPYMDTLVKDKKNGLLVEVGDEESLCKAILSYKSIDIKYNKNNHNNNSINLLFEKVINNELY